MNAGHAYTMLRGYPERDEVRESLADRVVAGVAARLHRVRRRGYGDADAYFREIERTVATLRGAPLEVRLPQTRYRLRRDGYTDPLILECLALCLIGLERKGMAWPAAITCAAAAEQLRGRIAVLPDSDHRFAALALAATAAALSGEPVHVLTRSDVRAAGMAQLLRDYGDPLGMSTAAVTQGMDIRSRVEAYAADIVCATQREIGLDYLRDRLQLGARHGALTGAAVRLAGDAAADERLLLRGLHCAFAEDAELVMIDDARLPLVISAEADQSRERLLYEQALELARALEQGRDFVMENSEPALSEGGRQRLVQLVSPLGGIWAARSRCEELIVIALRVLHALARGRDYQVAQGRVMFPPIAGEEGVERDESDEMLQKLAEVKEGCALSGRRDVLARISAPRILNRYLRLAGVCSDTRSLAHEFWSLYRLKVTGKNPAPLPPMCGARVFVSEAARLEALVRRLLDSTAGGYAVVIAVRTQKEAQSVTDALSQAGVQAGVIRGRGDDADRQTLAGLAQPGAVAISCYPVERSVTRDAAAVPLHLLVAELHDARRHVEFLRRIYAASRCDLLLSLENEAVKALAPTALAAWVRLSAGPQGEASAGASRWFAHSVQAGIEREQRVQREELMSRDIYLSDLLAFSGQRD